MRRTVFLVAVTTFLVWPAIAEEPPEQLKLKAWEELVESIRGSNLTTLDKAKRLNELAEGAVVVYEGKIQDIAPSGRFPGGIDLVCCGLWGGEPEQTFTFRPNEVEQVKGWGKWDRLTWRAYPEARGLDRIRFRLHFHSAADLNRVPNPGPKWRPLKSAKQSFRSWKASYDRHIRRADWVRAFKAIQEAEGLFWAWEVVPFYLSSTSTHADIRDGNGNAHRIWIRDPQVVEMLKPGQAIVVGMTVDRRAQSPDGLRLRRGRFLLRYEFWRLP